VPSDWRERGNVLPLTHGISRDEDLSAQAAEGVGEGERASATCCLRFDAGQANPVLGRQGKLLISSHRRHDRTGSTLRSLRLPSDFSISPTVRLVRQ